MKIVLEVLDCASRVACSGTFTRPIAKGPKPKTCPACVVDKPATVDKTCGCGETFTVDRGSRLSRCNRCREDKVSYRMDSEGNLAAVRAETLRREAEERAMQAGKERAQRLFEMMQPLVKKYR